MNLKNDQIVKTKRIFYFDIYSFKKDTEFKIELINEQLKEIVISIPMNKNITITTKLDFDKFEYFFTKIER